MLCFLSRLVVMSRLGARPCSPRMDENWMRFIVDGLFPRHSLTDRQEYSGPLEDVPIFSEDELSPVSYTHLDVYKRQAYDDSNS